MTLLSGKCPCREDCILAIHHNGRCANTREVLAEVGAIAKRRGLRIANALAAKVLRALGHEVES